ncbi:MAG: hypothetical protein HFE78_00525 [Clostridiales bacterium]|nr:hypothetical protein [Clostridiales bacterium]
MMKKRIFCLLLAMAAMLAGLSLAACQKQSEPAAVNGPENTDEATADTNLPAAPEITICTPVATGICIVGGISSANCDAIEVSGDGIETTKIIPDYLPESSYFIGQIALSETCEISVKELYEDGASSAASTATATYTQMENKMTADEYMPVFVENSRMHFYSALLSYTLSDVVTPSIQERAEKNIAANKQTLQEVNPDAELIYLVVPSSAAVYPESLPEAYKTPAENSVFSAFKEIAEQEGATVIYPLDSFIEHKNDGFGYKIYHNTDSHWSTYGAYWGIAALMEHVAEKHPAAAPRSVSDMGFYTETLWGGDALFSFGDNGGFENYSKTGSAGKPERTKISELTTLYSLKMPTDTLSSVYRGGKSIYVNGTNSSAATIKNQAASDLPTAVICRDSFGCTAYDMVNDRFSTVYWQNSHSYKLDKETLRKANPDYVIYIVSERNLLKVMLENANISICNYAK